MLSASICCSPARSDLHAAEAYSIPNAGGHPDSLYQVSFRPHADGISNLPYSNKNDWPVIAWGSMCGSVRFTERIDACHLSAKALVIAKLRD